MDNSYDVFISYNRRDNNIANEIVDGLESSGVKCFFDVRNMPLGMSWIPHVEKAIQSIPIVVVILGNHGLGAWQRIEAALALDLQAKTKERRTIPVLVGTSEYGLSFLSLQTWLDLRNPDGRIEISRIESIVTIVKDDSEDTSNLSVFTPKTEICPYRGLKAFREEDAAFFYGRNKYSKSLVKHVASRSIFAIVGPSGTGKSSVVFAGLIPKIRTMTNPHWNIVSFVPGPRPLLAFAATATEIASDYVEKSTSRGLKDPEQWLKVANIASSLEKSEVSPGDLLYSFAINTASEEKLLMVIDQWEELYTLCENPDHRQIFIQGLLKASRTIPNLVIVITLRADFYGEILNNRELADALEGGVVSLAPMNREELAESIASPASKLGISLEEGLLDRIVDDVITEPGGLPLMEYLLTSLWKQISSQQMTHADYLNCGGIRGAIAQRAESIWKDLNESEKQSFRALMLRLVTRSTEHRHTRRRVLKSDINEREVQLVKQLVKQRLLVSDLDPSGNEVVEVAHEALFKHWGRLGNWLVEDDAFLIWRQRLAVSVDEWAKSNDNSYLLAGLRLSTAQEWWGSRENDFSPNERSYLLASFEVAEEKQKKEELEQLRQEARLRATELLARREYINALDRKADEMWPVLASNMQELQEWMVESANVKKLSNEIKQAKRQCEDLLATSEAPNNNHQIELHDAATSLSKLAEALDIPEFKISAEKALRKVEEMGKGKTSQKMRFENPSDHWLTEQLSLLLEKTSSFLEDSSGTVNSVGKRLGQAEFMLRFSKTKDIDQLWNDTLIEAEKILGNKIVHLSKLRDRLYPLGVDPQSGLLEFLHLPTHLGALPYRTKNGTLVESETSGLVLVLLAGGRFYMGAQRENLSAPNYDLGADADEGPVTLIDLNPFLISKYATSQSQWGCVMEHNPSYNKSARHPVESVSFYLAAKACERMGLELPAEAQWEYSARGGTDSPFWTGKDASILIEAAVIGQSSHSRVNSGLPNAFGLYQILGNVWEWCGDWYCNYNLEPAEKNGARLGGSKKKRVFRGGGFNSSAALARCALRFRYDPGATDYSLGFRCCLNLD